MDLLILGGTRFLGRHLTEQALAAGHRVTLFNRGLSGPDLFPEAELLTGDRDGGLEPLRGRSWDAVIDTSGYVPRVVEQSARLLSRSVGRYVFISTISVYASFARPGIDESVPPLTAMADPASEDVGEYYGELKARCEETVAEVIGDRGVTIRPGLIVGPYDSSDRFTHWPWRLAQGGEVLAPGRPQRTVQLIDVRDLAAFTLVMAAAGEGGVYNANGPERPVAMGDVLEACRVAAGGDPRLTWVPDEFLVEAGAGPWMEVPLWIPESDPDAAGFFAIDCSKALRAGLAFRPLAETVRDTMAWVLGRPPGHEWKAGLRPERERELLAAYAAGRGPQP